MLFGGRVPTPTPAPKAAAVSAAAAAAAPIAPLRVSAKAMVLAVVPPGSEALATALTASGALGFLIAGMAPAPAELALELGSNCGATMLRLARENAATFVGALAARMPAGAQVRTEESDPRASVMISTLAAPSPHAEAEGFDSIAEAETEDTGAGDLKQHQPQTVCVALGTDPSTLAVTLTKMLSPAEGWELLGLRLSPAPSVPRVGYVAPGASATGAGGTRFVRAAAQKRAQALISDAAVIACVRGTDAHARLEVLAAKALPALAEALQSRTTSEEDRGAFPGSILGYSRSPAAAERHCRFFPSIAASLAPGAPRQRGEPSVEAVAVPVSAPVAVEDILRTCARRNLNVVGARVLSGELAVNPHSGVPAVAIAVSVPAAGALGEALERAAVDQERAKLLAALPSSALAELLSAPAEPETMAAGSEGGEATVLRLPGPLALTEAVEIFNALRRDRFVLYDLRWGEREVALALRRDNGRTRLAMGIAAAGGSGALGSSCFGTLSTEARATLARAAASASAKALQRDLSQVFAFAPASA